MTTYDTTVDTAVRNSSHSLIIELVGQGKRVLDVGCATGYLAKALGDNGCEVSGVEIDPVAAAKAEPFLKTLVVANIEREDLTSFFEAESFDAVVFGDVLEHMIDPERVVKQATQLLRPGGALVASIPNVSHGSVRLALLQGRWEYRELGLLDRTHVHFFTKDTVLELMTAAGLTVTEMYGTILDPLKVEVEVDEGALPENAIDWVRDQEDAYTYQFVFRAVRSSETKDKGVDRSEPAVEIPRAESDRQLSVGVSGAKIAELTEKVRELEHSLLTSRDFAIGAAARVAVERGRADQMEMKFHGASEELRSVHRELAKLAHELQNIKSATTWKVGSVVTAPASMLRRAMGPKK